MKTFILKDILQHKELQSVCGIYMLKDLLSEKIYIGQSIDIYRRLLQHKNYRKNYIDQTISIIGSQNFMVKILEQCSIEELDEREKYYISYYDSTIPMGYNLTSGGQGQPGEENPAAVLNEQDVLNMRILYTKYERNIIFMLYPMYTERTITSILSGQNWTHLPIYKKRGHTWSFPSNYNSEDKIDFYKIVSLRLNYFNKKIKEALQTILYE